MLLSSGKHGLPGSYRTLLLFFTSSLDSTMPSGFLFCFVSQWTNSPSHETCHTKTKKQHWNNDTSRAWTQCSAAPLCLPPFPLCISVCVHTCTSRCLRKWENPKILNGNWPGGSLLIAPATSKERRGNRVKVTEYETNTKQTSATAGSRVLILPFNPQTASELLFKDVFKSLNHL